MFIRFTTTNHDFFIRKQFGENDQIVTFANLTNTTRNHVHINPCDCNLCPNQQFLQLQF
jgi:hypothetical protein